MTINNLEKTFEKKFAMQLTKRDVEILQFINEFGFCTMPYIEKRFLIKSPRCYQIMQRLIKAELVKHKRVFHAQHGIYYLTQAGARFTDLPPIDKISLGIYDHQLNLINVYLKLRQQFPDTDWISERHLKHSKFFAGVGRKGHVADGVLAFPDAKHVAIEVEQSTKGKERIKRILKTYRSHDSINEVWYYCPDRMISILTELAARMPFVKIFDMDKFLA